MKLKTAGLLIIKNRQLLLAYSNNKKCFYLPGGKINHGETYEQALCREISEELNIALTETDLQYYRHITAPAYGEKKGVIMEQECFFVHKPVSPVAAAEIGKLAYFSVAGYLLQPHTAPGAVAIMQHLKTDGYID